MELKKQRCNCGLTSFLVHETKVVILLFNINIKGIQRCIFATFLQSICESCSLYLND